MTATQKSLFDLIAQSAMVLSDFLYLAVQLSGRLAELHQENAVIANLNPKRIYWDGAQNHLVLEQADGDEKDRAYSRDELAYIAPEQTGLINRDVDHRAHLYTLGAIFYHCLTGETVFGETDDQALVQAHLTTQPVPLNKCQENIPSVLSDVVMKLLAKNPEDRYQSALGLQIDLLECQDQLTRTGEILPFDLGRLDYIDVLQISNRLYGREREIEQINRSFREMDRRGVSLLLVAGYSGVGKTSLIETLIPEVENLGGMYVSGKYDQFTQNVAFDAVVQAFQSLVRKTLGKEEAYVAQIKSQLLDALGENGQVIIDLIPDLALLIGDQPDVPELSPEATKNRFHFVFQNFVSVFTSESSPLVLFLDDLQWIDQASLDLLFDLVCKSDLKNVLIVGAYRDNEVNEAHPLVDFVKGIQESNVRVDDLNLLPIHTSDLNVMISDILSLSVDDTKPLSDMVYAKTQGNPFFVKTLIRVLYESHLLVYDAQDQRWTWDLPAIGQLDVAENVAEFLAGSIQNLPRSIQQSLQYAACMGNAFDLHVMAEAQEKNIRETALELETAVRMHLISPVSESAYQEASDRMWPVQYTSYRFLHDRVQEASDRLLSEDQRKMYHLHIGQTMLAHAKQASTLDDQIIDIAQHLNMGSDHITISVERIELAQLNLTASKKAKASAAFEQACEFAQKGIEFLPKKRWGSYYPIALEMYEVGIESAFICGEYGRLDVLFNDAMDNTRFDVEKVKFYEIKIRSMMAQNQFDEAIKLGLDFLADFNLDLDSLNVKEESKYILNLIKEKSINELLQQPQMKNSDLLAISRILEVLIAPTYQYNLKLNESLLLKLIRISIESGVSVHSANGYAFYGLRLAGDKEKIELAKKLAELAVATIKKLNIIESKTGIELLVFAVIKPWVSHLKDSIEKIRQGIEDGRRFGDVEWAGRLTCFYSTFGSLVGINLYDLEMEVKDDNTFLARHSQFIIHKWNSCYRQFIMNLLGRSEVPHLLIGEAYDENESLENDLADNIQNFNFLVLMFKTVLCYKFGHYRQARILAQKTEAYEDGVTGMIFSVFLNFYQSLSYLSLYPVAHLKIEKEDLAKIVSNQANLKFWSEQAPVNFLHKYWLVEAEKARVLGQEREASEYYDKAISLAKEHEYINEEALANERAGYFYEGLGRPRFAEVYIREAHRLYEQWGAKAKTDHLAQKYPHWFVTPSASEDVPSIAQTLDVNTLIQATKTFTDTAQGNDFVHSLMEIVMQNSGAQRGVLILQDQGQWCVEAEATVNPFQVKSYPSQYLKQSESLLSHSVVQYVLRTQKTVILDDACVDSVYRDDAYVQAHQMQSVLCLPILYQRRLLGVLYLENNAIKGAFTQNRVDVLHVVVSQMAISLSNTLQYETQLQSVRYLYDLRTQLESVKTISELVDRAGVIIAKHLESDTDIGFEILVDQHQWQKGNLNQTYEYRENVVWSGRVRGYMKICSNRDLDKPIQDLYVTETASQLSRILEARELQMQLLQSARLVSLGQMAAGMAHELNQPLGALSNVVNDVYLRLRDGIKISTEELSQMMQDSMGVVNRMSETINHLRVFSRDEAQAPPEPFDLNAVVDSSLQLVGAQLKNHGVDLQLNLAGDLPMLMGHGHQMEQVVLNLLANARDAVLDGERNKRVVVRSYKEGAFIGLEVCDSGVGIAEADVGRVFEPFFTTKSADKGTGLGLSISYAIVKNHGGEIVCDSTMGEGSVFRVMLPIQT